MERLSTGALPEVTSIDSASQHPRWYLGMMSGTSYDATDVALLYTDGNAVLVHGPSQALWNDGAYLEAGPLWLCLSRNDLVRTPPHPDYTHIAFSIAEVKFAEISARLKATCDVWKDNCREGASVYFLDPDGHKLEVHVGDIETRLAHYRSDASKGVHVLDD